MNLKAVYLQNNWRDYTEGQLVIQQKEKKTAKITNFKPDKYFIPNLIFIFSVMRNYYQN